MSGQHIVYFIGGPADMTKRVEEGYASNTGTIQVAEMPKIVPLGDLEAERTPVNFITHTYYVRTLLGVDVQRRRIYAAIHSSLV